MTPQLEIMLIAMVVAAACALPGTFLVLRGMSLMSDAISHSILLGIVVMFFAVKSLNSPLLIIGAAMAGVLTVTITEMIINTKRVKQDAAIGLVFPVFFSIGVIIISRYAGNIHIDTDAVLLGELAFAPFHRLTLFGIDFGPNALWVMGSILLINLTLLALFYKELKLATFDSGLACALGFSPTLIHYGLMSVTSVTAVGAFDAVGSILVVALMIAPPATAYLLTHRLSTMLFLSCAFGLASAITGYGLAFLLDVSIAGSMATMSGIAFVGVLLLAPDRGLISKMLLARTQRLDFASRMLTVQLLSHEGKDNEESESTIANMVDHMGWAPTFARQVVRRAVMHKIIRRRGDRLHLTGLGREVAKAAMLD